LLHPELVPSFTTAIFSKIPLHDYQQKAAFLESLRKLETLIQTLMLAIIISDIKIKPILGNWPL
jgi:hypothetical protein